MVEDSGLGGWCGWICVDVGATLGISVPDPAKGPEDDRRNPQRRDRGPAPWIDRAGAGEQVPVACTLADGQCHCPQGLVSVGMVWGIVLGSANAIVIQLRL